MAGEQTCLIFILTCTVLVKKYAILYYRFTDLILNFSEAMYSCKAIFCSVRWLSLTGHTEEVGRVPGLFPGLDRVPVWV